MWDAGLGICVGCGKDADRDIGGRCMDCFKAGVPIDTPRFKEMSKDVPGASVAHIRDLEQRRVDLPTGKMYYDKGPRSYFYGNNR